MTRSTLFRRAQDAPRGRKIAAGALMLALLTGLVSVVGVAQAGTSSVNIFGSATPTNVADTDTQAVELGTKFKVQKVGWISSVRFYKSKQNIGTHTGTVWLSTGEKLGTVTFSNESASGWQTANLPVALLVRPDLTYVVSYHTNVGRYSGDQYYFAGKGAGKNAVRALADGVVGSSGVYRYGSTTGFPTSTYRATNYYVDVQFKNLTDGDGHWNNTTLAPNTTGAPASSTTAAPTTTSTTKAPVTTTTTKPVVTTPPPSGSVPCDLTIPAKACWATNTGVPGWTEAEIVAGKSALKHSVGNRTITADNTVIDGEWIDGCLSIKADNVTIKNSLVRTQSWCYGGDGQSGPAAVSTGGCHDAATSPTNLVIIDSEVDAGNTPPGGTYAGVSSCNYSLVRADVHGAAVTLWAGHNVNITDSFIHDPTTNGGTDHTEAIDADSGDHVTMNHNWISAANSPQSSYQTGGISINNSWGPAKYFTVTNNFIEGANGADVNFGAAPSSGRPWGEAQNITFTGNRLSPFTGWGNLFSYGWNAGNPGMVWSDNRISESLKVLAPNGS
jgi:hypothetical protein